MKGYLIGLALLAVCFASLGGCDSGDEDATDAIREIYDSYESTILSGDADGWISNWTDDPVALWADFPVVADRAEMAALLEDEFGVVDYTEFDIMVDEVVVAGSWAFARGTYTWLAELVEGGDQLSWDGKFLTIFQKQSDGSWKIHRDIYNSNVPTCTSEE